MKKLTTKVQVLVFAFLFMLTSCGSNKESETSEDKNTEENTETNKDTESEESSESEEADNSTSSEDLPEVGKGIGFYAEQYQEKYIPKQNSMGDKLEVEKEIDNQAGYAGFRWHPGTVGNHVVDLGLWVTNDKKEIIGVFTYIFSAYSQGAEPTALKFYNTQWEDITEKVVNISEIEQLSKQIRGRADITNRFIANIPKKGTTIKLSDSKDGSQETEIGELRFDLETGKFTLVKK